MISPQFLNVGANEAMPLEALIPTGDDTEGVEIQTLTAAGYTDKFYTWNTWMYSEPCWVDGDLNLVEGVTFDKGSGLWVQGSSTAQGFQSAGKVGKSDVNVRLRNGATATGNPFPVNLALNDILPNGGDDTSVDLEGVEKVIVSVKVVDLKDFTITGDVDLTIGESAEYTLTPNNLGIELKSSDENKLRLVDNKAFALAEGTVELTAEYKGSVRTLKVEIKKDDVAPVISSTAESEITISWNENIDIFEGITAIDNIDKDLEIELLEPFDKEKMGEQTITYIATDSSGNKATLKRKVTKNLTKVGNENILKDPNRLNIIFLDIPNNTEAAHILQQGEEVGNPTAWYNIYN